VTDAAGMRRFSLSFAVAPGMPIGQVSPRNITLKRRCSRHLLPVLAVAFRAPSSDGHRSSSHGWLPLRWFMTRASPDRLLSLPPTKAQISSALKALAG
jgi:hypothetical protein